MLLHRFLLLVMVVEAVLDFALATFHVLDHTFGEGVDGRLVGFLGEVCVGLLGKVGGELGLITI